MKQGKKINRKELKPPPKYDYHMSDHLIREWFLKAKRSHLKSYVRIGSWSTVKRLNLIKEMKILNYK